MRGRRPHVKRSGPSEAARARWEGWQKAKAVLEKQAAADRHLGQAADAVARRDKVGRREVAAGVSARSWGIALLASRDRERQPRAQPKNWIKPYEEDSFRWAVARRMNPYSMSPEELLSRWLNQAKK
jgi:hypothetical protein